MVKGGCTCLGSIDVHDSDPPKYFSTSRVSPTHIRTCLEEALYRLWIGFTAMRYWGKELPQLLHRVMDAAAPQPCLFLQNKHLVRSA